MSPPLNHPPHAPHAPHAPPPPLVSVDVGGESLAMGLLSSVAYLLPRCGVDVGEETRRVENDTRSHDVDPSIHYVINSQKSSKVRPPIQLP